MRTSPGRPAGDVADWDDEPLVVLEMARGVAAPHTGHRLERAHDFNIAQSLAGGNHAAMNRRSDLQVRLETIAIVVDLGPIRRGRFDDGSRL